MSYRILLDSRFDVDDIQAKTGKEEYAEGNWIVVNNISNFSKIITANFLEEEILPELISFEFNLGFDIQDKKINPKAETGADAIKWLVDFCVHYKLKLPEYIIHAENPQQARDLNTILRNSKELYSL